MKIGVLSVQGAFAEHEEMLKKLKVESFEIRNKSDLNKTFDGLILPGGESTVMGKLLQDLSMFEEIQRRIQDGLPVFGTCAGLILLAKEIEGNATKHLATMSISAKRNAYGRQLGSFQGNYHFEGLGEIPMTFIRAPYINNIWDDTKVLARVDNNIVAAREKYQLATAFHPELTACTRVHEYFLQMVRESMRVCL